MQTQSKEIIQVQTSLQHFMYHSDDWKWNSDLDNYGSFYCPDLISRHEDFDQRDDEEDVEENEHNTLQVDGFAQRRYEDEYIRSSIQRIPQMLSILKQLDNKEAKTILAEIEHNAEYAFENPHW